MIALLLDWSEGRGESKQYEGLLEPFNALEGSEPALARLADGSALVGPASTAAQTGVGQTGAEAPGQLVPCGERIGVREGLLIPSLGRPCTLDKDFVGPARNRDLMTFGEAFRGPGIGATILGSFAGEQRKRQQRLRPHSCWTT